VAEYVNVAADVKRFEAILNSKQPDLLSYCGELTTTRDCIQAIRNIRDCKYHIHLAEMLVANRYATLLSERKTDATDTAGGKTSPAAAALGPLPLTAPLSHATDAAAAGSPVSRIILLSHFNVINTRVAFVVGW